MPGHESVIQLIRERIDYLALFTELLPSLTTRGGDWRSAFCVFHENTDTPALGVNVAEGYYVCRNPACDARGDFLTLYQRVRSLGFREAVAELAHRVGIEMPDPSTTGHAGGETGVIDEQIVESAHGRLLASPTLLDFLATRRGLTLDTVRHWQLGHDGQRYFIPIRDEVGRVVNIRRYKPGATDGQKMLSWRPGYGSARLWPFDSLARSITTGEPVLLLEGEMDTLLALQYGFAAMCATGGAGTWRDAWTPLFRGRDVVLCYDIDAAGRTGAAGLAHRLTGVARRVRDVRLPITEPHNADFTDYIVGHGHTAADFLRLLSSTPEYAAVAGAGGEPPPLTPEPPSVVVGPPSLERADDDGIPTLHLSHASEARYYNESVRVAVMVSGKTTAPYLVPKRVRMGCSMPALGMCESCPVARAAGTLHYELAYTTNEILQLTGAAERTIKGLLKGKVGVPTKCTYARLDVQEAQNVEEIQIIPEIDRSGAEAPYVTRQAFYLGHGLVSNRSYLMTGLTVPTPDRQLATHLITQAVPSQSNIDAFRLSADVVQRLQAFQPPAGAAATVSDLWQHLDGIYEDLECVTRIWARRDLLLAVDLVFHSVLTFDFLGDRLVRGWTEALVIGDSRTGKTSLVQRLIDHYGAGEMIAGENTTLAGLVGGLHQIGNAWALQWGKLPLNDRRLLAIDEAANLGTEQIGRLSSLRSSGIAEIVKVHTERTNSRTRSIWITNPRGNKPLSSYSQGVLAVKELIGAPEDIARFDLVVTAASGDVSLATVNTNRPRQAPARYDATLCHQRVMWAWSRAPGDVEWAPGAAEAVLRHALRHGERYRYATEIPLVEPNEQRVKLARLAVAAAALFFSTDATGQRVVVQPAHVDFVAAFLDRLYAKPSLAFDEYGTNAGRRFTLRDPGVVQGLITRTPDAAQQLMEQEQFTQRDLQEILSYNDRDAMREAVTTLRENGFLRRVGSSFYVKTPAAIAHLRRYLSNGAAEHVEALVRGTGPTVPDQDPVTASDDPDDQPPF